MPAAKVLPPPHCCPVLPLEVNMLGVPLKVLPAKFILGAVKSTGPLNVQGASVEAFT